MQASSFSMLRQHTKLVLEHRMLEVNQMMSALKTLFIRYLERYVIRRAYLYIMLLALIIRALIMRKYDYQDTVGFIVRSTTKVLESAFDQQLRKKADITGAQSRVIAALALVKDGMTQKEIANRIGVEAPTIVPMIDKLEEQGIVIRRPDHNDRRNNLIFLAGESEAKWELIIECAIELEKASRQGLSKEELEITKRTLCKITQNVAGLYLKSSDQIESRRENSNNTIQVRKQDLLHQGK